MILLELFWSFCKIGFTSFGGLSMVPLINSEMLSHGWMTLSEVSDIVAIAEMTPGPLGLNCATFAGTRVAGLAGAVSASLGVLSPTLLICAAAAVMFEKFRESDFMKKVMYGIRPACLGLIIAVVVIKLHIGRSSVIANPAVRTHSHRPDRRAVQDHLQSHLLKLTDGRADHALKAKLIADGHRLFL